MSKKILFVLGLLVILGLVPVRAVVGNRDAPPVLKSPTHAPDYRPGEVPFLPMSTMQSDTQMTPQAITVLPWSKVVFQSYRHGNWEIYASNDDGSGEVRLTSLASTDIYPRFNRGATRVAFASNRTGNYDLFVMNADGSAVRQLTSHPANDYNPAWSPDGSKIVFSSYRDGQSEIYVMNADGSNQTRLTFDAAYDGTPVWSPDGSKIAFSSNRSGVVAIWVMNADGTVPTLLSYQPYAQNPVWSPDGSQIAYDADGDNDGWQELWLMNADGSSQRQIYKPFDSQTDAWMRSWSPDGRYIAFTRISFVYYQGNWYWIHAYLDAWDSWGGNVIRLNSGDTEWYPDWQTTDILPPISNLNPLPAQSPSPIQLSWSGVDVGPAGLHLYEVQVKEGVGGVWTNCAVLLGTSVAYPGIGGRTYYFRVRASDNAGNVEPWPAEYEAVTTVEAIAPVSQIESLLRYYPSWQNLRVSWSGHDPGNSGINSYDIQYRIGNGGIWSDWLNDTPETWGFFPGEPGYTYYFRSRATDKTQNVESWPIGDGDAVTTLYTSAVTGTIRDNTHTPVADATVTTMPQPVGIIPSDNQGIYQTYLGDENDLHALTITKAGYGHLPSTDIEGLYTEIEFNVILPPSDNVIRNGDFETLPITTAWMISGTQLTPPIDLVAGHTGKYALKLGQAETTATNVSYPGTARGLQSAVDSNDILHVIWVEDDIYYAQRSPDGDWSIPYNVTNEPGGYYDMSMVVGGEGIVHLVWLDGEWADNLNRLFYANRQTNGSWSSPRFLTDSYYSDLKTAVTVNGTLHIVWLAYFDYMDVRLSHVQRNADGIWKPLQEIATMSGASGNLQLEVDAMNSAHIAWTQWIATDLYTMYYTRQESSGDWRSPQVVKYNSMEGAPELVVDNSGIPQILWGYYGDSPSGLYHTYQESDGSWSLPQHISGKSYMVVGHQAVFDEAGDLHVVWTSWQHNDYSGNQVFHTYRGSDNVWTSPQSFFNLWGDIKGLRIATLPDRGIQAVWTSNGIYYARQDAYGMWSVPQNVASGGEPRLAMTSDAATHLLWIQAWSLFHKVISTDQSYHASLAQIVAVPERSPVFSLLYHFYGASPNNGLIVTLDNGATATRLFSITDEAHHWTHTWSDLTPWAGQTVTLSFDLSQEPYYPAPRAYLDEISLGGTYPDLWVQTTNLNVQPGDTAVYEIFYGNRGGAPAENVRIVGTLPEELTFVDANPKPVTETAFLPAWVWNLGTLSAKGEPSTLVLTATVALTTPTSSPLMSRYSITSTTPELELANNTIIALTVVDYKVYLPLILRKH